MLKPAILYKDELLRLFSEEIYTEEYFLYVGFPYAHSLPEIDTADNYKRFAILNSEEEVIGYLSYHIDISVDCVSSFGLYSFDKGNPTVGKDLFTEMERLVQNHHRIEWRMVGGNPVERSYDKFCKKHNGKKFVLTDTVRDLHGKYRNCAIYEIITDINNYG